MTMNQVETSGDTGAYTTQGPVEQDSQEVRELREKVSHMERMLTITLGHVEKAWTEGARAVLETLPDPSGVTVPPNPYAESEDEVDE